MSHPADAWMPWFGDEFYESERVASIEPLAQWAYQRLLWRQWKHGSIPAESERIRALLPVDSQTWDRLWPQVEQFFPEREDGRRANARCTFERKQAEERIEKSSEHARRMNAKRWSVHKESLRSPTGVPKESQDGMGRDETRRDRTKQIPPAAELAAEKAPRVHHPSEAENVWQSSWRARRGGEPYELTKADVLALNRIAKKHGHERLAVKCDALLDDMDPWVYANASPTLLVKRWSNLGREAPIRIKRTEAQVNAANAAARMTGQPVTLPWENA